MNRIRLSTTVDAQLLGDARNVRSAITDAALIDEALGALLARHRSAEVDASYAAYDRHPSTSPMSGATWPPGNGRLAARSTRIRPAHLTLTTTLPLVRPPST